MTNELLMFLYIVFWYLMVSVVMFATIYTVTFSELKGKYPFVALMIAYLVMSVAWPVIMVAIAVEQFRKK